MKVYSVTVFFLSFLAILPPAGSKGSPAVNQERGGTISGLVELPAQVQAAKRERSSRYRSSLPGESSAEAQKGAKPEATNVVIYLSGEGLGQQNPSAKPILDQRDADFIPHILPVVRGTSVRIVNRDKTYHNVFSLSSAKKFNIGRRPTGEEVPITFDKTGVVQVFCDIHSNMSAFVVVLDNSAFVQPQADGAYSLKNVPPGKYAVNAWHERFSASPQQVTVKAGEALTVNFTLQ